MGPKKQKKQKSSAEALSISTPKPDIKTERDTRQTETDIPVNGLASDAAPTRNVDTPAPVKEKVIVTLNENGGLDLDAMRPKTKERLIEALKRSQSGLLPVIPDAPIKRWPDVAVRGLYGLLGAAETAAAARKFPMEVAQAAFMFSDQEIKILMDPTQAVLSKYGGKFDRYQEEIALGLVLVQIHFAKMHNVKTLMAQYEERKAAATPPVRPAGPAPGDEKKPVEEPLPELM